MTCEESTKAPANKSLTTDFWKHSGYVRSLSMSKSDANKILNAVKDGRQTIDLVTITAALWVTGDVDSEQL
jgi:hypothetical protein